MYNLSIHDFEKAKEGSIFVKRNGKLVAVSKEEFLKDLTPIKEDIRKIKEDQKAINEMNKFFDLYSKPHFQVVFNAFINDVFRGIVEVEDEYTLKLDQYVARGEVSVKDALKRHKYLEERFNQLFVDNKKELKGFWEV